MKAWIITVKDEPYTSVVFAETRGKARYIALNTEAFEDCEFIDIEVRRVPHMDKYYTEGRTEMDWENPKDRYALVNECGFSCEYVEWFYCDTCSAKEICDTYQDHLEYMKDCEEMEDQT